MGGGVAGQVAGVHGNAAPGEALHVGHFGSFVDTGLVVNMALQDGEYAGRGIVAGFASADSGAGDVYAVAIDVNHLVIDTDDDQQRAARGAFGVPLVLAGFEFGLRHGQGFAAGGEDDADCEQCDGEKIEEMGSFHVATMKK